MSHFTTIKIQLKNGEILHQVLLECGYQVECNTDVRGYQGNTTRAEYVIRQTNGYDIGFRFSGETYEVVSDWGFARINQKEFVDTLNQKYAHKMLRQSIQEQGFNLEAEEILEDGSVRVVVGKWV
jgi:hypothetical protein